MSTPTQQPTNPTEILAALYRVTAQARIDANQRLEAILKVQNEQAAQMALLKQPKQNNYMLILTIGTIMGIIVADWWVRAYISQTIIGDAKIALWDFLNGKEYGMGLSSGEILFVVITRFMLGFSGTFGTTAFILLAIDGLTKLGKGIFKK